jgi:hypothetical protein
MTLRDIQDELLKLEMLAVTYTEAFNGAFDATWNKRYAADSIINAGRVASNESHDARERLNNALDTLCDRYLQAVSPEREELRNEIARCFSLLRSLRQYIGRCETLISTTKERTYLRRGLAAASLEDNRVNYKEMYVALGSLYRASVAAGIHPSIDFVKIGYLSNDKGRQRIPSTKEFLANFEESAFFKSDVEPKLRGI